ncbi:HAD family hydrolase [Clostridium sp.]|uniref:HAD family hydrolase n=1 Tax=Clostridium sp. TaxID=1506 RepID=UPI00260A037E|nr:HAD family hydrolase [Clostridium sp.]
MKAIGFDLGRTLIGDENIPLSWKSLYKEALIDILRRCNSNIDDKKIAIGEEILLKYNTRINYRECEVSSDVIFSEILIKWKLNSQVNLALVKETFFNYFQRNVKLYEDTILTLKTLKERGIKIGILTDVPYGMDKELVLADIEKFKEYVDIVLTSVEVGYRKPNKQGFLQLSKELMVDLNEMIYVGDEEKDIIGANCLGIYSILINRTNNDIRYGQRKTIKKLSEILDIT